MIGLLILAALAAQAHASYLVKLKVCTLDAAKIVGGDDLIKLGPLCFTTVHLKTSSLRSQNYFGAFSDLVESYEEDIEIHAMEYWHLDRIDSPVLDHQPFKSGELTGEGVSIYVIDTGVNVDHPDLGDRGVTGETFVLGEENTDLNGHGTHVATVAAGNTVGVARGAEVVGVKVLNNKGSGTLSQVLNGMAWAVSDNPDGPAVMSMSLGGSLSRSLNEAAEWVSTLPGWGIAVAAGNENKDARSVSPASAGKNVVTVGATDDRDFRASFSNYGDHVDIWAPGVSVTGGWFDGTYKTISGTSMATPIVAGAMAILFEDNLPLTHLYDMSIGVVKNAMSKKNGLLQVDPGVHDPNATRTPTPAPTPKADTRICFPRRKKRDDICVDNEMSAFGSGVDKPLSARFVFANDRLMCDDANAEDFGGAVVVVDRGSCFFHDKVKRAEQRHASAVVIVNSDNGPLFPPHFYGEDDVTIPSCLISRQDGNRLRKGRRFTGEVHWPESPTSTSQIWEF